MILHIISSYSSTPLYKSFAEEVDLLGFKQIIYNPVRDVNKIGNNNTEFKTEGSQIIYSNILKNTVDKFFYKRKINRIQKDIESKIDLTKVKAIHAHTWFSDGGVAYKLSQKYNIPYIVVIRNTDVNLFYKYLLHERGFGRKILLKSSKIILISASYKNKIFNEKSLQSIISTISNRISVIPNGVDKFWLQNTYPKKQELQKPIKILYIGRFAKGKNVGNLQKAIIELNNKAIPCVLHLIGGDGPEQNEILELVNSHKEIFTYHGKIYDKEKLSEIMRSCDIFAMPSKNETFGLVYMEALLQGLPILYTKNEGIDGFYDDKIGEAVDNISSSEILKKLEIMIEKFDSYKLNQELFIKNHNWSIIALKYQEIYNSIINK